ncbi:MAG TPA: serine/threonine-protein kinase [Gemmatimonadaceae bacterium]|nr:serine/threonine-protein kinase [Gemmatimonadaceae bacterium]
MTRERWVEIKAVVADAMELPVDDRAAYLDRVCAHDAALRAEVESLLEAADDGDSLPGARAAVATAAASALGMHGGAPLDAEVRSILDGALGQQYEMLRMLGHGGMGTVYLARDRALERFVAIKVLRPDVAALHGGRERFRREARIVAQLSHPGILSLYTFGEVHGLWYFVTEYVRGVSLAERLRVEGRLESGEVQRILAETAEALACAHQHGVIHRDIKPANILLDEESGRAVLADFGIAKLEGSADELTKTGAIIGTPNYMSPEQAAGEGTVDARSDIYSLGAVGYAMLTGREPLPPDPLPPSVSRTLAHVIMRALARDASLRWPSARMMSDTLARATHADDAIPESFRDLPSFGPYALLWAIGWMMLAGERRGPYDGALLFLVALVVPIGLAFHIWNLARHGGPPRELARVAFWPPEWWGMWWPRALRRPGDVWRRLPLPARATRAVLSAFCVGLPALVLLHTPTTWKMTLIVVSAIVLIAAMLWARRRALDWSDAVRVLFGATTPSPIWSEPQIARLLASNDRVRPPDSASAADHRRAISELAALLPADVGVPRGDIAALAHRLLSAIEACSLESAALARDANAAELDRLEAQVSALESDATGGGNERHELVALVRRQLELVRGMRVRAELVAQRRARLFALMRGLWAQLRVVSSLAPERPDRAAEFERLFGLREEIETELSTT